MTVNERTSDAGAAPEIAGAAGAGTDQIGWVTAGAGARTGAGASTVVWATRVMSGETRDITVRVGDWRGRRWDARLGQRWDARFNEGGQTW